MKENLFGERKTSFSVGGNKKWESMLVFFTCCFKLISLKPAPGWLQTKTVTESPGQRGAEDLLSRDARVGGAGDLRGSGDPESALHWPLSIITGVAGRGAPCVLQAGPCTPLPSSFARCPQPESGSGVSLSSVRGGCGVLARGRWGGGPVFALSLLECDSLWTARSLLLSPRPPPSPMPRRLRMTTC